MTDHSISSQAQHLFKLLRHRHPRQIGMLQPERNQSVYTRPQYLEDIQGSRFRKQAVALACFNTIQPNLEDNKFQSSVSHSQLSSVAKYRTGVEPHRIVAGMGQGVVSGHNGKMKGYDYVGHWTELPGYADMMNDTVAIVRQELAAGRTQQDMQSAGIFDDYEQYAGSYVSTDDWINYVVDALTVPRDTRSDICKPIYEVWKRDGGVAAVKHYQSLLETHEDEFDFSEYILMGIGSKLYLSGNFQDAVYFFRGSNEIYPGSEYGYYTHYLSARALQKLGRREEAITEGRESVRLNDDFENAKNLLKELTG